MLNHVQVFTVACLPVWRRPVPTLHYQNIDARVPGSVRLDTVCLALLIERPRTAGAGRSILICSRSP